MDSFVVFVDVAVAIRIGISIVGEVIASRTGPRRRYGRIGVRDAAESDNDTVVCFYASTVSEPLC